MTEKTCAACDCQLDANPIRVKVGGKTVEVCCEECAVLADTLHRRGQLDRSSVGKAPKPPCLAGNDRRTAQGHWPIAR